MFRHHYRARLGERSEPAHLIRELAYVARPAIEHQILHRLFGESQIALRVLQRELLQVVIGERGNFHAPFAQWRQVQGDDAETVEEVLAEASLANQGAEVG